MARECPQLVKRDEMGPTLLLSELNNHLKETKTLLVLSQMSAKPDVGDQYLQFQDLKPI